MVDQGYFSISLIFFFGTMSAQRYLETHGRRVEWERGEIKDRWTLSVLTVIHVGIILGSICEYFIIKPIIDYRITLIGLCMYSLSFSFRKWSIKALGKYHSIHIEIREKQTLIRDGPYRYVRNPYYISVVIEVLGIPLIPNAYFTFVIAFFLYLPAMFLRIFLEEKALMKKFGEEYERYQQEVSSSLPFKSIKNLFIISRKPRGI